MAEDIIYLSYRTWQNHAGTHLEAVMVLESARTLPEEIHKSYLAVNPIKYNNNRSDKTRQLAPQGHACYRSNQAQHFSYWI